MKRVKNTSGTTKIWCGQEISNGEYYTLQPNEIIRWANNDTVLEDIAAGKLVVNNGDTDLTGTANQINFLKDLVTIPLNPDGRPVQHATPRILGTYTYFSGTADDPDDPTITGNDDDTQLFCGHHEVGQNRIQQIERTINCIQNETYVYGGYIQWQNARNDTLTFEIVPQVTPYSSGSGTNFNLYGGFLIIPAAGNGLITVNSGDIKLVECTPNEFGVRPAGYWNATWNPSTKTFDNLTPAPSGNGNYNIFGAEIVFSRYVNRLLLLGDRGILSLLAYDVSRVGHGAKFKITAHTMGDDHDWWWNATIVLYRKKTC